jgi:hypothetical protein
MDSREEYYKKWDDLYVVYLNGVYDGKKAALASLERNFCERCGKRTPDLTTIHTCTPPQEKSNVAD